MWRARSEVNIEAGRKVVIKGKDGVVLMVELIEP